MVELWNVVHCAKYSADLNEGIVGGTRECGLKG